MAVPTSTNGLSSAKDSATTNTTNSNAASSRPAPKPAATPKSADASGKSTSSPAPDSFSQNKRFSTQHKAWTGSNPITRSIHNTASQQNGSTGAAKQGQSPKFSPAPSKGSSSSEKQSDDRVPALFTNLMGRMVTVTDTNGGKFEGVFSGSTTKQGDLAYTFQMARKTKRDGDQNGVLDPSQSYVGDGPNHTLVVQASKVVEMFASNVTLNPEASSKSANGTSFQTDTAISGNRAIREKPLQRWQPDPGMDVALESGNSASDLGWDQFETNKRLYNVQSDYNEAFYTTTINTAHPDYKKRVAEAERMAKEIEQESSMNAHVREERGLKPRGEDGLDEEDKYSGVRRSVQDFPPLQGGTERYTPPARRAPTGKPTVRGAPVDPAIISSQIARPDGTTSRKEREPKLKQEPRLNIGRKDTEKVVPETTEPADQSRQNEKSTTGSETIKSSDPIVKTIANKTRDAPKGKVQPAISHTANVEQKVSDASDAFKDFAKFEKMRLQTQRRTAIKTDKEIKLNDLMKFSQTFKLHTPVPKDLLSILARDPSKQEKIAENAAQNAARNAAESDTPAASGKKPPPNFHDEKAQRSPAKYDGPGASQAMPERQPYNRSRGGHSGQGGYSHQQRGDRSAQTLPARPAPGPGLSQRLANIHNQARAGGNGGAYPNPLTLQDSRGPPTGPGAVHSDHPNSQRSSGAPTPLSATSGRFNVKAMEFRPNPAASTFTPNDDRSAQSSPRSNSHNRPASRNATPSDFWGTKKPLPLSERPSIDDCFNPFKRLKREAKEARESKDPKDTREIKEENGGIPWAHRTLPRWDATLENAEKTYLDAFNELPTLSQILAHPAPIPHPHTPHHQHLPYHNGNQMMQNGPHSHQIPQHLHPHQPHHNGVPHQYDDHRMHYSASTSSVYPSPRMPQANLPHQSPMPPYAQLAYQQPMQYGPAGGVQMGSFRSFSGGPQMVPHMPGQGGAPMMAHNPSNGPYMNVGQGIGSPFNQQMPIYGSPAQGHAYPQGGGPPSMGPGHGGYPSPGRGAPLMMHQGSQQGQPPQMMMYGMNQGPHHQPIYHPQQGHVPNMRGGYVPQYQGQYAASPHQQHHHPMQHRGSSNGGYNSQQHHSNGPPASYAIHPQHGQEGEAEGK